MEQAWFPVLPLTINYIPIEFIYFDIITRVLYILLQNLFFFLNAIQSEIQNI